MKNLAQRAREIEATNHFGVDMVQIEIDRFKREEDNLRLLSAYNQKVDTIEVLRAELNELKQELKPVIKFHTTAPAPPTEIKKRLTKAQREQLEIEREQLELEQHIKMLELESLERIKKGN